MSEFEGPNYKEKLDITQVFLRQRDRTNFSAAALDGSYEAYVKQTMRLLPLEWKQWVRDQADRYTVTEPVLVIKRGMGSQKKPCLRDRSKEVLRLEDGSVDWSDENILSPVLEMRTRIDYEIWDDVVGEAAEYAGISWQTETSAGDRGGQDSVEREKTPYRQPGQEDPE